MHETETALQFEMCHLNQLTRSKSSVVKLDADKNNLHNNVLI